METKLEKEVRLLKAYALVATISCLSLIFMAFTFQSRKQRFEEIDVERINVVERDGKIKLVITNKERQPDAVAAGKTLSREGNRSPAILFYNDEGDEAGGLVFSGRKENGTVNAGMGLFFDQYQQDQTIGLTYNDFQGQRRVALMVWDRPNIPLPEWLERLQAARKMKDGPEKTAALKPLNGPLRLYVGKTRDDNASAVLLSDAEGRTRIRMKVSADGVPKLEFLNEAGQAIQTLPDAPATNRK